MASIGFAIFKNKAMISIVVISAALFGLWFSLLYYTQAVFQFSAYDLGLHDQGIWLLSQGLAPFSSIKGVHLFGDHLSFHYFFSALGMRFWNSTSVLYVVQVGSYVLSGIIIFLTAKRQSSSEWAFLIAFIYLLHPAVNNMVLENFHPEVSVVLPLSLISYFYFRSSWIGVFIAAVFALIAKEDIAISIFSFSLFWCLQISLGRFGQKKNIIYVALGLALLSIVYFLVGTKFLMPRYFMGLESLPSNFSSYWFKDLNWQNLTNWQFVKTYLDWKTWKYLGLTLIPWIGIFIYGGIQKFSLVDSNRRKKYFDVGIYVISIILLVGPSLLVNLLSRSIYLMSIDFHYSYVHLPMLAMVSIFTVQGLVSARTESVNFWFVPRVLRKYNKILVQIILVAVTILWHEQFSHISFARAPQVLGQHLGFLKSEQSVGQKMLLRQIQDQEKVSAQHNLVVGLAHRQDIFMYPNPFKCNLWNMWYQECKNRSGQGREIDRIVLTTDSFTGEQKSLSTFLLNSGRYTIDKKGSIILLTRRKLDKEIESTSSSSSSKTETLSSSQAKTFGKVRLKYFDKSNQEQTQWVDSLQFPEDPWVFRNVWGDEFHFEGKVTIQAQLLWEHETDLDFKNIQCKSNQLVSYKVNLISSTDHKKIYQLDLELDFSKAPSATKGLLIANFQNPDSVEWLADKYLVNW